MKRLKKQKMSIGIEDYIKANKKLAREEELQRNGGRWVAKDRPHKNLKKYDRKRESAPRHGRHLQIPGSNLCRRHCGVRHRY